MPRVKNMSPCSVKGCTGRAQSRGMCLKHYCKAYGAIGRTEDTKRGRKKKEKQSEPWETSGFFAWDEPNVLL